MLWLSQFVTINLKATQRSPVLSSAKDLLSHSSDLHFQVYKSSSCNWSNKTTFRWSDVTGCYSSPKQHK